MGSREFTRVETCDTNEEVLAWGLHHGDANDGAYNGACLPLEQRVSFEEFDLQRLEPVSQTRGVAAPTPVVTMLISSCKKPGKRVEMEFFNHLKGWEESFLNPILVSAILARQCFAIPTTCVGSMTVMCGEVLWSEVENTRVGQDTP